MTARLRIKAFVRAIALLMFFITFFASYMLYRVDIVQAFIKSMITYVVATIILNILVILWNWMFSPAEWKRIVDAKPKSPKDQEEYDGELPEAA